MKNKILTIGLLAAVLSACADGGALKKPEPLPAASPSCMLKGYNAGADSASAASSLTAVKGEKIVLVWSASTVTSALIQSEPKEVIGNPVELTVVKKKIKDKDAEKEVAVVEGSGEFEVSRDATYTLVALNKNDPKNEKEKPTDCKGSVSVKAVDAPAAPVITSFTAKPASVAAGETAELCWEVTPADSVVTITDEEGKKVESTVPVVTGDAKAVSEGGSEADEPTTAPVETGDEEKAPSTCIAVTPEKTMTYTIAAASAADANLVSRTTTVVTVKAIELNIVSFAANGVEGSLMLDKAGDVKLSWEVTPAEAVVTIDNGVGEMKSSGDTTVKVEKSVTYTLTASLGAEVVSKQVSVSLPQFATQNLTAKLTADTTNIFAGESVTFSWAVSGPEDNAAPAGIKYVLDGPEGRQDVTGSSFSVKPELTGAYALEASVGGIAIRSNQVHISVRKWDGDDLDGKWGSLTTLSDDKLVVFGSASNKPDAIKFGRLTDGGVFEEVTYKFSDAFKSLYFSSYDTSKLNDYGSFPVNAIGKDAETGRLYAAIAGGLLFSDNKGQSWDTADIFPLPKGRVSFANAERKSCKGSTQKGDASGENTVANLVQTCDVVVVEKRVIVATDVGLIYMDTVDGNVGAKAGTIWQGLPEKDGSTQNALALTVVNKLLPFGGDVYAGTEKGVWVSKDKGATWTDANGGELSAGAAIYALALSAENKMLFAGGPDGVYYNQLGGSDGWKKFVEIEDGGAVYSLAVDAVEGNTIYAGTEKGVFVKRSCCPGGKWINITESMGGTPTVYGLATGKRGLQVGIYAATSAGVFSSVVTTLPFIKLPVLPIIPFVPAAEPAAPAASVMKTMF